MILHTPVATGNKHYTVKRLFERLHSLTLSNQKAKKVVFPEVDLLQIPKGQYVVLVSALARNVNLSKQLAQGLTTAVLYLGQSADYQKDVAEIRIVVIDPTTRTPVWRSEIKGEVRNEEEARREIGKLFKDFPPYKGNAAGSPDF